MITIIVKPTALPAKVTITSDFDHAQPTKRSSGWRTDVFFVAKGTTAPFDIAAGFKCMVEPLPADATGLDG